MELFGGFRKIAGKRNELLWTGLIPDSHAVKGSEVWRQGLPGLLNEVRIRYKDSQAEFSTIQLKAYEQGRGSFEGTSRHFVWMDEEPPLDVYSECVTRTMTSRGIAYVTFTPLDGITPVILLFLPASMRAIESGYGDDAPLAGEDADSEDTGRHLTQWGWDDVPHITPAMIRELWRGTPRHLRRARRYGEPVLGVGRVYEVDPEDLVEDPFRIPDEWRRVFCIDPGWNRTAALWAAVDDLSGTVHLYSEYYESHKKTFVHAAAVLARGSWIPGLIDPAAIGTLKDGENYMSLYAANGVNLSPAENALESGIASVTDLMTTGRLKISRSCRNLVREMGLYKRDDKGKIPKGQDDHLLDCMRYIVTSGMQRARAKSRIHSGSFALSTESPADALAGF